MGEFAPHWLRLREPYDHAARSGVLAARFVARLSRTPHLIDLGCGTGSNLRYLAPRLGHHQTWICIDHDAALLDAGAIAIARWGEARGLVHDKPGPKFHLRGTHANLDVHLLRRDLADPKRGFGLDEIDGITASAFLDIVSADWIESFTRRMRTRKLPILFALSFDGRLEWRPAMAADAAVRERFHAHQRTDKGFGPALGPDAAARLASSLEDHGFRVRLTPTDWRLDASDHPLLAAFFDGFVDAVREIAADDLLGEWSKARRQQLARGRLALKVGHVDLLALPA